MNGLAESFILRFLTLIGVSCLWLFWLAAVSDSGWPGFHWDTWYFADLAFDIAKSGEWNGKFREATPAEGGETVFYNHGLIHPLIFGKIFQCSNYADLAEACLWLNWVTTTSWTLLYWPFRGKRFICRCIWAILAGCSVLHMSIQLQGRPEQLCVIIALPSVLMLRLRCGLTVQAMALAVTVGVLFVASPVVGMNGAMFIIGLTGAMPREHFGQWQCLKSICAMGCVAISVSVLLVFAMSPSGVVAWFSDLLHRERTVADNSFFFLYWFNWPRQTMLGFSVLFPFWNVLYLLLLVVAMWGLLQRKQVIAFVLFVIISGLSLRAITDYGVLPVYAACILAAREMRQSLGRMFLVARRLCTVSVCLGTLCAGLSLHQSVVVHRGDASRGKAVAMFRSCVPMGSFVAMHFVNRPAPCFLMDGWGQYISGFVVPSLESIAASKTVEGATGELASKPVEFAVLGQTRRGDPPSRVQFDGAIFSLVKHNWTKQRYRVLGVEMPAWQPGIRLAVYRRVSGGLKRNELGG